VKTIGCLAVHYGKEYLAWAVRGLAQAVDEVHVFYAASPSFGHVDWAAKNPDTEEQLVAEANRYASVSWHRVSATCENEHRDNMLMKASEVGASIVAIADADEIWDSEVLTESMRYAYDQNKTARWQARFHNFWRSWYWTVKDHFAPIRIVDMRHPLGRNDERLEQRLPIYHFGYAQCLATMHYKLSCHGHKAEFKPGWLDGKFITWDPITNNEDLHPCINDFWKAVPTELEVIDELNRLMPEHPYRGRALIA
jgi:hypothetical protein